MLRLPLLESEELLQQVQLLAFMAGATMHARFAMVALMATPTPSTGAKGASRKQEEPA